MARASFSRVPNLCVVHQVFDHGKIAAGREYPVVARDDRGVDVRVRVDVAPDLREFGMHRMIGSVHLAVVEPDAQNLRLGPVESQLRVFRIAVAHRGLISRLAEEDRSSASDVSRRCAKISPCQRGGAAERFASG